MASDPNILAVRFAPLPLTIEGRSMSVMLHPHDLTAALIAHASTLVPATPENHLMIIRARCFACRLEPPRSGPNFDAAQRVCDILAADTLN